MSDNRKYYYLKRNKEKVGRMAINSHIQLPNSILKYF